jgi:hypothetical protein
MGGQNNMLSSETREEIVLFVSLLFAFPFETTFSFAATDKDYNFISVFKDSTVKKSPEKHDTRVERRTENAKQRQSHLWKQKHQTEPTFRETLYQTRNSDSPKNLSQSSFFIEKQKRVKRKRLTFRYL